MKMFSFVTKIVSFFKKQDIFGMLSYSFAK